jgi:hypothetical protein
MGLVALRRSRRLCFVLFWVVAFGLFIALWTKKKRAWGKTAKEMTAIQVATALVISSLAAAAHQQPVATIGGRAFAPVPRHVGGLSHTQGCIH